MSRGALLAAILGILATGCLVHVEHVSDPGEAFEEAQRDALRLQGRSGPAKNLNVLVYDADEEQLVRVRLPMWLARKLDDEELVLDGEWNCDRRVRRKIERRIRLEDLEEAGLGILVEVDEDDGERVLIWLS